MFPGPGRQLGRRKPIIFIGAATRAAIAIRSIGHFSLAFAVAHVWGAWVPHQYLLALYVS